MTGRNTNIYFPEALYDKLRQIAGPKISRFVSEAVEEKIKKQAQIQKEQFRQKLIADYQSAAASSQIQKEVEIWDETLNDAWKKDE